MADLTIQSISTILRGKPLSEASQIIVQILDSNPKVKYMVDWLLHPKKSLFNAEYQCHLSDISHKLLPKYFDEVTVLSVGTVARLIINGQPFFIDSKDLHHPKYPSFETMKTQKPLFSCVNEGRNAWSSVGLKPAQVVERRINVFLAIVDAIKKKLEVQPGCT